MLMGAKIDSSISMEEKEEEQEMGVNRPCPLGVSPAASVTLHVSL